MNYARPLAFAVLLLPLALSFAHPAQGSELTLQVGKNIIRAEIADTPQTREHGLMQRKTLCPDCGMLFVFPFAARYGFWMKNTSLPLAIAFIGRDGRIVNIAEMQPYSQDIHYAQADALYGLEMNGGWFAAHDIHPGEPVLNLNLSANPKDSTSTLPLPHAQK